MRWFMSGVYVTSRANKSKPKACIRGEQKLAQYWKSKLRISCNAEELKLKSTRCKKHGAPSWIVISKRVNKYVTALPEENKKPFHYEEVVLGSEPPVATK